MDSLYFINFKMLKKTKTSELSDSYKRIQSFFKEIATLLKHCKTRNDMFYKQASKKFIMNEFEEICLGYAEKGTSGSGSGRKIKESVLDIAKNIIDAGIEDPIIFELIGLFKEDIGSDRISDMIAHIIKDNLIEYSKRVINDLKFLIPDFTYFSFSNGILINPYNNKLLILLPMNILHKLPIATGWDDIELVCNENDKVRDEINKMIGKQWSKLTKMEKRDISKKVILSNKELIEEIVKDYLNSDMKKYDFENDPTGESIWYKKVKTFTEEYPLTITKSFSSQKELTDSVLLICDHFKALIENNGLNEILYDDQGSPRHERIAQKLFYGVSSWYCKMSDTDLSPEVNSGRGALDFKISKGYALKVLVEVKLTTNSKLLHGYKKQLNEYRISENAQDSIYLVIDNGGPKNRITELRTIHNEFIQKRVKTHHLIIIDGIIKKSASKF